MEPYRLAFDSEGYYSRPPSRPTSPVHGASSSPSLDPGGPQFSSFHDMDGYNFGGASAAPEKDNIHERDGDIREEDRDWRQYYVMPPHRYLFNCYVYHYNLIQIAGIVIEMVRVSIDLFFIWLDSPNISASTKTFISSLLCCALFPVQCTES